MTKHSNGRPERDAWAARLMAAMLVAICLAVSSPALASDEREAARPEASTQRSKHDGWEYDPYYVFPLTRHMPDSGLPQAGQFALYPFAFVIDLLQWPIGALAGLAGK